MVKRLNPEEQGMHDKAVLDIMREQKFYPLGSTVIANPSSEKNREINGQYPDIVCFNPRTNMDLIIGEVETESSVNDYEATHQWSDYAKLNGHFYLFVPDSCFSTALDLVKRYNIRADVHMYHYLYGTLIVA